MLLFFTIGAKWGLLKHSVCLLGAVCKYIMEEMYLCEMFLPKKMILSKSLLSHLTYLDVWFQWNIDDLTLFDH